MSLSNIWLTNPEAVLHASTNVILLLHWLEYAADSHQFLRRLKPHADYAVIHFPLDLSAFKECGFEVVGCQYTGSALTAPQRNLKTKMFGWLRRLIYSLNKNIGVRLLGGETLMVFVRPIQG